MNMGNKIPQGNYVGYLWYSDANKPEEYIGDGASIDLNPFPFIVEGMLWDKNTKTSVMLNYTHRINVAIYPDVDDSAFQIYMGHKSGNKNLKFTTIWEERKDELCEGMKVLKPKASVFVGFDQEGTTD